MNDPRGSVWRKWDLHVHTPLSFHWKEGTAFTKKTQPERDEILDRLTDKIVQSDIAVFGIMDYWTFDGYLAVKERIQQRGISMSKTILPGMELRIEAPVDYRLNIQVVLSDSLSKQQLQDFKGTLCIRLIDRPLSDESLVAFARRLDASKARVHGFEADDLQDVEKLLQLGSMTAVVTRESLQKAIKQVPAGSCLVILPYDTSDGLSKLDWETHPHDDNYFMQSAHIFETREPDNVDLFLGRETDKNKKFLANFIKTLGGKPKPAISGSDAHKIADYGIFPSNRITWIKADPTFEGLRQTLYEPSSRVRIAADKPVEPLLAIRNVIFNFPTDTTLVSETTDGDHPESFCFRGKFEITFSPYLTCLIGGRGSGKSTALNLINEKLNPGKTKFFAENRLMPKGVTVASCVSIDGDTEEKSLEFIQQNQIEQFATAPLAFTTAVFDRLAKLDSEGKLAEVEQKLLPAMIDVSAQAERLKRHDALLIEIATAEKELATAKALVSSFENPEYKAINAELAGFNRELQGLKQWRERLEALILALRGVKQASDIPQSDYQIQGNAF